MVQTEGLRDSFKAPWLAKNLRQFCVITATHLFAVQSTPLIALLKILFSELYAIIQQT